MSNSSFIVEINEQNFNEVLQQSLQVPILLDFWADWCEPCKTLTPVLEKLVEAYQGKFILAKVNADEQQAIAQQLGVRSLPTLKFVVKGQLAGELVGAQPESEIRAMLEKAIPDAPLDQEASDGSLLSIIEDAKTTGNYDQGVDAIMQALESQPENNQYKAWLADLFIDANRIEDAQSVLAQMPKESKEKNGPTARLQFINAASELPPIEELMATLAKDENDIEALLSLGVRLCAKGDFDGALAHFMAALTLDSGYQDEAARKSMIGLFEVLGNNDERVKKYRRQMFTLLH